MVESEYKKIKFDQLLAGQKVKTLAKVVGIKPDGKNKPPKWFLYTLFDGTKNIRVFFKEDPGYKKDSIINIAFESKQGKPYQGNPQLNYTIKEHSLAEGEEDIEQRVNKIGSLTGTSKGVRVIAKVMEINDIRNITLKDTSTHEVGDLLIADETGCIILTLWDDDLTKITGPNNGIEVMNGYCSVFKEIIKLNVGKFGELTEITDNKILAKHITGKINVQNNLSVK